MAYVGDVRIKIVCTIEVCYLPVYAGQSALCVAVILLIDLCQATSVLFKRINIQRTSRFSAFQCVNRSQGAILAIIPMARAVAVKQQSIIKCRRLDTRSRGHSPPGGARRARYNRALRRVNCHLSMYYVTILGCFRRRSA